MAEGCANRQAPTEEAIQYCMRGIVQYLNGDTKKFNEYVNKAIELNDNIQIRNTEEVYRCFYYLSGKKIKATINMQTGEVRDLQGNILREGVGACH